MQSYPGFQLLYQIPIAFCTPLEIQLKFVKIKLEVPILCLDFSTY